MIAVHLENGKVTVNRDETRGYVVSDPGISVIALEDDVRSSADNHRADK